MVCSSKSESAQTKNIMDTAHPRGVASHPIHPPPPTPHDQPLRSSLAAVKVRSTMHILPLTISLLTSSKIGRPKSFYRFTSKPFQLQEMVSQGDTKMGLEQPETFGEQLSAVIE